MIFSNTKAEHYASFAASQDALDEIREFAQSALFETGLSKKSIAGLLLAIEEAVSNIVRHGYLYGPGKVRIRIRATRSFVSITLADHGRPYEVNWDEQPTPRQLAETGRRGGLGLLLMRKVTDGMDYRRVGAENFLTLTKRIARVEAARGRKASSRRVMVAGILSFAWLTAAGAVIVYLSARAGMTETFMRRWQEFARASAASATQHLLNNRSDAEFDQLVYGLKQAQPDLAYLVIVDDKGDVRAHSEEPEKVHTAYKPPPGLSAIQRGVGEANSNSTPVFHFSEVMTLDRRPVGTVAVGVGKSVLDRQLAAERWRVVLGALTVMAAGGILVFLVSFFMGRPLRRLGELLHAAKSQGAGPSIPTETAPDEIAEVVAAINEVTEAVALSERQIAQHNLAQRDLVQAEQLQRALLPQRLPDIPGYEAQAAYQMAQHVGGDYYDVIPIDGEDGRWAIIVADVAGKGFPAALVMTAVRTATRILAPSLQSPVEIVRALNRHLARHHDGGPFVTIVCGVLDTNRNVLTVASAGHTPALHRLADGGAVVQVNPKGSPVGVQLGALSDDSMLASQDISLSPGDAIILYTDGLTEARNKTGEAWGHSRLIESLGPPDSSASAVVTSILERHRGFSGATSATDDVTVVVLRRRSPADVRSATDSNVVDLVTGNIAATF